MNNSPVFAVFDFIDETKICIIGNVHVTKESFIDLPFSLDNIHVKAVCLFASSRITAAQVSFKIPRFVLAAIKGIAYTFE